MDNLKLTTARININLTINKMLLRLQLEKMSDEKRIGIQNICNDLEQVRITLSELESENRQLMQENTELLRINLELNSKLAIEKIYEL
jgi:glycine cleavage system regulatory protein